MRLRRRPALRSCHPVFVLRCPVQQTTHSPSARVHRSQRRSGDECRFWPELWGLRQAPNDRSLAVSQGAGA